MQSISDYMKNPPDTWNRMVKFIRDTKDSDKKQIAEMLMRQYNTAGGRRMEKELISFLESNEPKA